MPSGSAESRDVATITHESATTPTSLPYYIEELERYDLVRKSDGTYALRDNVVRDYLASSQL